jgi:hypothetical protein
MAQMRDLPPIAGAVIWACQIENQSLTYMKRVEDVLEKHQQNRKFAVRALSCWDTAITTVPSPETQRLGWLGPF